mgnify:CR=1 FL=1
MTKKTIQVELENGFEARPVALLVQEASKYDSTIYFQCDGKKVNAKSIMGMMALGILSGEEVKVSAEGDDEQNAIDTMVNYLTAN